MNKKKKRKKAKTNKQTASGPVKHMQKRVALGESQ